MENTPVPEAEPTMFLPPSPAAQQTFMWPAPVAGYRPPPTPGRNRRAWVLVALAVAMLIVLVAVAGGGALWYAGKRRSSTRPTANSSLAPSAIASKPADIFSGTSVGAYADGADGIVLPAAAATPNFSRSTVAGDLAMVKQVMIATRLDPKALTGHDPSTFIGMLAPDQHSAIQRELDNLRTLPYLTEIGTSGALTKDPIKVAGTMTYAQRADSKGLRVLEVTENYVFVYPFVNLLASIPTKAGDQLAVVHENRVWSFPYAGDVTSGSNGMWMESGLINAYNVDCSQYNVGLLVVGSDQPDMTVAFDPNTPVDEVHGSC
jgi:hypothetical protein